MKKLISKTTLAILIGAAVINPISYDNLLITYGQEQVVASEEVAHYPFSLMPLPYPTDALEPYISQRTVELHHGKHMQTYVDNLNKALEAYPKYHTWTLEQLLSQLNKLPKEIRTAVKNNGGGIYNHQIYFAGLGSDKDMALKEGLLKQAIIETFGSEEQLKTAMKTEGLDQFGSGWSWLMADEKGNLTIEHTANQETLLKEGLIPIIGVDVWEHAYYLDYQNKRDNYIDSFWQVLNWDVAAANYEKI